MHTLTHLADFKQPLAKARKANHRLLLVLAMPEQQGISQAQQLTQQASLGLWVDVLNPQQGAVNDRQHINQVQASQYLGTSHQYVVFNAHRGFNANAFCGLSGTIEGGGVLVLLVPHLSVWHQQLDTQLEAYGHLENKAHSSFIQWWQKQWQQHHGVYLLQQEGPSDCTVAETSPWQLDASAAKPLVIFEPSIEQQDHIDQVVTAYHQQKPMLFTLDAHRGRGKSACLGWLIKAIGSDTENASIIVTAPSKRALVSMVQAAEPIAVHFHPLDALILTKPEAKLLIIDEAAGIPMAQLKKLIEHYKLVVLASTQDGYEGSGQGYRLKLPRIISSLGRKNVALKLSKPMRWASEDPLEILIRSSFLCDVKAPERLKNTVSVGLTGLTYSQLSGQELAINTELLRQVYGLLMLAHYQTTPQDLRMLLDHPQHKIHLCHSNGCLVSIAWVAQEGGLAPALASSIALGERRIQGHLLAQILAQQAGFSEACEMASWRIQRLVVLPSLQGSGIGSAFLKHIFALAHIARVDFVGASFAAQAQTLGFWEANHFTPVWLGLRADGATGLNSVQVMQPVSGAGAVLMQDLKCHLKHYLTFGKDMWFESVDRATVEGLYSTNSNLPLANLSVQTQKRLLTVLASGKAGFSGSLYLLLQHINSQSDRNTVINAAQNNTHKGLQKQVREIAKSLLQSFSH